MLSERMRMRNREKTLKQFILLCINKLQCPGIINSVPHSSGQENKVKYEFKEPYSLKKLRNKAKICTSNEFCKGVWLSHIYDGTLVWRSANVQTLVFSLQSLLKCRNTLQHLSLWGPNFCSFCFLNYFE